MVPLFYYWRRRASGISLTSKLIERGHQAILFRFPFRWEPADKIVESMLASRLLCLPNVDRAIALKFPAYSWLHA